jgi:hypothetical protein
LSFGILPAFGHLFRKFTANADWFSDAFAIADLSHFGILPAFGHLFRKFTANADWFSDAFAIADLSHFDVRTRLGSLPYRILEFCLLSGIYFENLQRLKQPYPRIRFMSNTFLQYLVQLR